MTQLQLEALQQRHVLEEAALHQRQQSECIDILFGEGSADAMEAHFQATIVNHGK